MGFGMSILTPEGNTAVSNLYNSYYIVSEGTATLGSPNPYGLGFCTIVVPASVQPYQAPLLLLKNSNKCEVGCVRANLSGSTVVSWYLCGGGNNQTTFDYAIAVAETSALTTEGDYGIQTYDGGGNLLFDSRRKNRLKCIGWGGFGAGYFEEGSWNMVGGASYEYFTAPMHCHPVWTYGYLGFICCRGTGPTTGYACTYVYVGGGVNIGAGGGAASTMLFFSKI